MEQSIGCIFGNTSSYLFFEELMYFANFYHPSFYSCFLDLAKQSLFFFHGEIASASPAFWLTCYGFYAFPKAEAMDFVYMAY